MPRKSKSRYPNKTTIWVSKKTVERLNEISKRHESYDQVLDRLLSGIGDVWVEILHVDGENPIKHEVLLRIGDFTYLWNKNKFVSVDASTIKTIVESN